MNRVFISTARLLVVAVLLLPVARPAAAEAERHKMTGVVLAVDPAAKSLSVSCDSVPGFMPRW
jgi:hypothetical protein